MLVSAFRCSAIGSLLAFGLCRASVAYAATAEGAANINPLDLTWVSPDPSCDGASVRMRALQLLPAGVAARSLQARAELSRDGSEWLVQLETHSENNTGRRVLRGSSCREIQEAIALLLAMILEAESRSEEAPARPPELPSPPPLPPPPPPMVEPVEPAPPPPPAIRHLGWLLRLEGGAAYGLQPGLGLGLGGVAGASWNDFEFGLGASYWPVTRQHAFGGAATLEMARENFTLVGCYRLWRSGRFELAPCLAPGLTLVRWRSKGIDVPRYGATGTRPSVSGALDVRFKILQSLFLALEPGFNWEQSVPFGTGAADNCGDQCQVATVFKTWALSPRLTAAVGASF
jgi:hypothetical protein